MMFQVSDRSGSRTLPYFIIATGMSLISSLTHAATAQAYVSQGPFVTPAPGAAIPSRVQVPNKEYSNHFDENSIGVADPMQIIDWDGAGGVKDSSDFTPLFAADHEIDGIANSQDALFNSVKANTSALLFSVENDGNIYSESVNHAAGIWANPGSINAMHPPKDVDGLQVWDGGSNRFSLMGDPSGVSVYNNLGGAMVTTADIAGAIGQPNLASTIDLDAFMFNKNSVGGFNLLFSIAPVAGVFDGGEIWSWDGVNPAVFLKHGGHVWNTAHCVACDLGLASENINALEAVSAVPVPAAVWLFGSGLLALFGLGRQKKYQG